MRYKYIGDARVLIPDVAIEVDPGEEFETDVELSGPHFKIIPAPKARPARPDSPPAMITPDPAPAKEN